MTITDFFHMGGYAIYVWSAYGVAFIWLFFQWYLPFRRWRHFLKNKKS